MDHSATRQALREAQAYLRWIRSFGMHAISDEAFDVQRSADPAQSDPLDAPPPDSPADLSPGSPAL